MSRFELEDLDDLARLDEPKLALGSLEGLVIIDEIQRRPELFPVIRVLLNRPGFTTRFLTLGWYLVSGWAHCCGEPLSERFLTRSIGGFARSGNRWPVGHPRVGLVWGRWARLAGRAE